MDAAERSRKTSGRRAVPSRGDRKGVERIELNDPVREPNDQMMEPSDQLNVPSNELIEFDDQVTPCHRE
jgi:hypothetical protein